MDNCLTQFQDGMKLHLSRSRGISSAFKTTTSKRRYVCVVQKSYLVTVTTDCLCVGTVSLPQLSKWQVLSYIDSIKATFCDVLAHIFNILRGINYLEQMI